MQEKWTIPHITKIYEAFSVIADNRLEIVENNNNLIYKVKVYSSSKNKFYTVKFDKNKNLITSNDNGSFYVGYLGYPSISLLLELEIIKKSLKIINFFKNIKWKDINVKNNNDFNKTFLEIREKLSINGLDIDKLDIYSKHILEEIKKLNLNKFGKTDLPPKGY